VIRAALFDIDGTLFMSSDGSIIDCLAEVLGVENRIRELDHPGRTIAWIAAALAGREPEDGWCARTEDLYLERLGDTAHWEARKGSEETLEQLHASGIRLGLVSGLPERVGKERLRRVGLGRFFDDAPGGYGCESPDRTELVRLAVARVGAEPAETLVVGDTVHDVTAAEQAGAKAFMYERADAAGAVLQAVL
jgi:phosphoglycolate phosphatase-like HAD superfamily hydrolase